MLGWEYPPRFAGGLGKACQGLSTAMAKQGARVFFVLPTFPERLSEPHLEVLGAKEALIEAGWEIEVPAHDAVRAVETMASRDKDVSGVDRATLKSLKADLESGQFSKIVSDAQMFPYGAHPEGAAPERIRKMMTGEIPLPSAEGGTWRAPGPRLRLRLVQQATARGEAKEQAEATKPPPASEIYGKNLWSEIEKFCVTVRHMAEAHEVDCVHAHDWMTFPAAFEFQRVTGAPVFLHVHATEYDRSGENLNNEVFRIEREGFRRATHIFAVSRYTAGVIERLYGVSRKKISVVHNAPETETREVLVSPDVARKPQVVFLGRLTFQKGPDHFLKAASIVAQVDSDAQFILCGTGDMMDKLRSEAHRLGIENRVHFAGFVDPAGVDQILMESKVLVMPSVSEPFGLVALEAIRCGIPVILSKQSGVREVLHRALQVDFWDHDKLADQMLASLRLPDLSRQLVMEGVAQLQELSWEKSARKVIDTYQRSMGSTYAQAVEGAHGH